MRLDGKVAIVTGAGSGIGRASTILFAEEGASVVASDIDAERGEQTVEEVRKGGGDAVFVKADVSDSGDVRALMRSCMDRYAALDVLFNCAAVTLSGADGPAGDLDEEAWNATLAINLTGTFLCCKHALPIMGREPKRLDHQRHLQGLPRLVALPCVLGEQGGSPYAHEEHRHLVRAAQCSRQRDFARRDRHADEPSDSEHTGDGGELPEGSAPLSVGAAGRGRPPRPVPGVR